MRCPLANVSAQSGGHATVGGGSTAAELEKSEVEGLIILTSKVGRAIEVQELKAAQLKVEKEKAAKKQQEEEEERHHAVNLFTAAAMKSMGGGFCKNVSKICTYMDMKMCTIRSFFQFKSLCCDMCCVTLVWCLVFE